MLISGGYLIPPDIILTPINLQTYTKTAKRKQLLQYQWNSYQLVRPFV